MKNKKPAKNTANAKISEKKVKFIHDKDKLDVEKLIKKFGMEGAINFLD